MNLVMAINMGADDFIAKPFKLEVITAKIQAMLRRTYDFTLETEEIKAGGIALSLADNSISKDGQKLDLTKNEFKILKLLMGQAGQIVSRDEIMKELWDTDQFIDDNTLTVNMTRLRKRLEEIDISDFIETKKGIGYRIVEKENT